MFNQGKHDQQSIDWLVEQLENLTDRINFISPSEWAEENRYLPMQVTPLPGYYRYAVNPPLREIVDCLDIRSPVREFTMMKGAQIGATVGVLENGIGYAIAILKSAPVMLATNTDEMAKLRMNTYITPMINQSGLEHLIRSNDDKNTRKTGKTDKQIEWEGGGFLIPQGAQSANKLRSITIQYLLEDERDGWPRLVGKDGNPGALVEARTNSYYQTRKIARVSTPLIRGDSPTEDHFKEGDQRYYNVPCRACNKKQVLRFNGKDEATGKTWGLIWNVVDGVLDRDSVRYVCRFCGHEHYNHDKEWMMSRGEWVATAVPKSPDIRSYHLSALYAPPSMFPWAAIVQKWLDAWDTETNTPKDLGKLQEFYNNCLGETFVIWGQSVKLEAVSLHRRHEYMFGDIPNAHAQQFAGSHILLITCAVDVHKDNLAVAVMGWTRGNRCYLIDYWRFKGDCEQLDDVNTWGRLEDFIDNQIYIADDGKRYRPAITMIDSQYLPDQVYRFAHKWDSGVYPSQGRAVQAKNAKIKEFDPFVTKLGTTAIGIDVNLYKDRWAAALRRSWDGVNLQPMGHFNAPINVKNEQLKELTVESKREKIDKVTQKRLGVEWYRPSGVNNELWDLLIYNSCSLDVAMWDVCINQLELQGINPVMFWDICEKEARYFER